jgi:hypothetical protein
VNWEYDTEHPILNTVIISNINFFMFSLFSYMVTAAAEDEFHYKGILQEKMR